MKRMNMSNSYPSVPPTDAVPPTGVVPPTGTVPPVPPQTGFPPTGTGKHTDAGTTEKVKDEAANLASGTKDAAQKVGGTAKDEATKVAGEAKAQAADLIKQTSSELKDQAGVQQKRVATGLHSLSDELTSMADKSEGSGVASDLVHQVAGRAGSVATWLEDRDPGTLLDDVKDFARRRPGAFIGIAAVAGVLAGRLTRSLTANAKDESDGSSHETATSATTTTPSAPVTPREPALYTEPTLYPEPTAYPGDTTGTDPLSGGRIVP
jgi:ElaB/YqjD/DUF883 family membrane-anchored ribosome-binding protein